jgi:hypothetical protein
MRSSAEQEMRDAVVVRLRKLRPQARICHEVNCGVWGPCRMDVVAVDIEEIIAVEIKSERDTLSRGPKQLAYMGNVTHHSIIALHEKHLVEQVTNEWAAHYSKRDRKYYMKAIPAQLQGDGIIPWVYPEMGRGCEWSGDVGLWRAPELRMQHALPSSALHLLWRDELAALCDKLLVSRGKRSNMSEMIRALWWHANGKELTRGICAALRRRKFAEADAAMAA